MAIEVSEVRTAEQTQALAALCHGYLAWLHEHYGAAGVGWIVDLYYPPQKWAALVESLPTLHAPPPGEMLLAYVEGEPCGCVMMDALDDHCCEMKRLYVPAAIRGKGLGRLLSTRLMRIAAERGYRTMRLDTANVQAAALYRRLGFQEIEPFYNCPPDLRPFLTFMEAKLASGG